MKNVKTLALSVAITGVLMSGSALAELSGNVGATSNYMWRGQTQTSGDAAVQGGVDYSNAGVYAGIWTSNTAWGSPETDFYVGYKGQAGTVGYDVSVINYQYLANNVGDWSELIANFSFDSFTAGLGYTDDYNDSKTSATYVQAGYSMGVGKESSLGFHVGSYSFDEEVIGSRENYVDYSIALSKGEWTFMYSDTDMDEDVFADGTPVFIVSWKTTVEL